MPSLFKDSGYKRRPKTLAVDKGYDAKWLRRQLRTKGIRPQIKKTTMEC